MNAAVSFFKCLSGRTSKSCNFFSFINNPLKRNFADTPKPDTTTKHVVVQGTENEERLRVRRARASDVPRVLRFVREHARVAWPGLVPPPSASHLVLCDYVARALAQGHSMLVEQQETRRGWSTIRGLALSTAVCTWDAAVLEQWARCVQCSRSRHFMHFTAHCLRTPALHDKYRVHNILQVILVVPPDSSKSIEIVHMLSKNAIQRGKDVGFPLIRFDVTANNVAKSLEELQLKKEWQLFYEAFPEAVKEIKEEKVTDTYTFATGKDPAIASTDNTLKTEKKHKLKSAPAHFVAVYTAYTQVDKS
ncbi:uncharacterized protein LOC113518625 [Galleria mellonella]|uniref:Uncharacterized protein LOC113518625 n=1 Tax=Galleria mellonella TaxID=7137 RepID=A0ABM3MS96_GALME|nr:uncharacterized protein LOC113518625 [Galleria mellonella]